MDRRARAFRAERTDASRLFRRRCRGGGRSPRRRDETLANRGDQVIDDCRQKRDRRRRGGQVPADAARTREETAMIDRYYREPRHHARSIVPDMLAGLVALLLTCFVVGAALGKANY